MSTPPQPEAVLLIGDFRALLGAVTRNVARRVEERALKRGRVRPEDSAWLQNVAADKAGQAPFSIAGWAPAVVDEASARYRALAAGDGESGRRRIELLENHGCHSRGGHGAGTAAAAGAPPIHRTHSPA